MTDIKYVELQTYIRDKIKDVSVCKKATSIALGISISRILPLPSTSVEDALYHYTAALRQTATIMVNNFNENIIVDIDLVEEIVRSYWLIRYTCAHPDIEVPMIPIGEFGFISKINNVGRFITPDTYKFCDDNSEAMVVLVNRITRLLAKKEMAMENISELKQFSKLQELVIEKKAKTKPASDKEIEELQTKLGFNLTKQYKTFLSTFGTISYKSEETYGLNGNLSALTGYKDISNYSNCPKNCIPLFDIGNGHDFEIYDNSKNKIYHWNNQKGITETIGSDLESFLIEKLFS